MGKNEMLAEVVFWAFVLAVLGGCICLGHLVGGQHATRKAQREAIETGHGHMVIADSLTGVTEFQWRPR